MFSFRGRISRLPYFVQGFLVLPAICLVAAIVLAFAFAPAFHNGNKRAFFFLIGLMMIGGLVLLWFTLALQTKRIRDMGWDPLIVLPAWFALQFCDPILLHFFPQWGIGAAHVHTPVSVGVNLLFSALLLLWPSADYEEPPFDPDRFRRELPHQNRVAALNASRAMPERGISTSFGRR